MNWDKIENLIAETANPLSKKLEKKSLDHGGVRRNYYRFFYLLAKEMKAKLCCEIGIEKGGGSMHFAEAGAKVLSIDWKHPIDYKNCISIFGDSCDKDIHKISKDYAKKYGGIDILYQDSSHHYLPSKKEWELYRPLMKPGGVWICDDITPAFYNPNPNPNGRKEYQDPIGKGMVQYWEEIPEKNKRLFPDILHKGNTHGIILL